MKKALFLISLMFLSSVKSWAADQPLSVFIYCYFCHTGSSGSCFDRASGTVQLDQGLDFVTSVYPYLKVTVTPVRSSHEDALKAHVVWYRRDNFDEAKLVQDKTFDLDAQNGFDDFLEGGAPEFSCELTPK